jgi:hypothetical protein
MKLAFELLAIWIAASSAISLGLGHFIQVNRPAGMHIEWVRSGDAA